jgi:O-antigen/teichoic acid export membrane protein
MTTLLIHAEMLKGLKRIKDSQIIQGIILPTLSSIGLLVFVKVWGLNGAVLAYVGASAIASLIGVRLWRHATPQLKQYEPNFQLSDLLRSALPLFWVSSIQLILGYTSTFFLGIFSNADAIGIFGAALKISMLISFILVSVNTIAAPKFAELYTQGNLSSLGKTVQDCVKLMVFAAGPVFLLFILAPEWILGFLGPKFKEGSQLLIILSIGQFINVVTGSVGYLLIMSGNESTMRNITVIIAFESIFLNLFLIKFFGALGAAVSTAISIISFNALAFICVRKKLKIWTLPFLPLPKSITALH